VSRTIALLAAGSIAALASAACGDDGASALTKDEYIDRGNEICADANDAIEERADEEELFSDEEPTEEEVERFTVEVSVPTIEDEIDDLRGLPAPEEDRDELNGIYETAEEGIAELREDPSRSASGELPSGLEDANDRARDYGLGGCVVED
jgi:hypothetical protein